MSSMITATAWVPRGHAAAYPTKYVFDEDEYARISKAAKLELDDAREDLERAREAMDNGTRMRTDSDDEDDDTIAHSGDEHIEDDELREYDMEHYDDDSDLPNNDDDDDDGGERPPTSSIVGNIRSLAYYDDDKDDPYITLPDNGEDSNDEERDELQILPTDSVVLAARVEDEVAHLEVYVYEDAADNLYVHHDVMLPAVPLCVEWLGTRVGAAPSGSGGQGANFAAVGTMDPEIELWDLDVVDGMYPTAVLGQPAPEPSATKKKKKKKNKTANDAYHVDAVLALAANTSHRNLLASASADQTTKLWDLTSCTAVHSYAHHTDKICALSWHPTQSSVLLSGSYDRTVVAADVRAPAAAAPRWAVESDVEQVRWDPHDDHSFFVSTEEGVLHCFDARQLPSTPDQARATWRLQAHEKSLSALAINPAVPGFIATGSADRTVKLWTVDQDKGPSLVVSRDVGAGKVFSVNFAPDSEVAFRLAVAGSKGGLQVWDTSTNKAVRDAFATKVKLGEHEGGERLVGVLADDEAEDDE